MFLFVSSPLLIYLWLLCLHTHRYINSVTLHHHCLRRLTQLKAAYIFKNSNFFLQNFTSIIGPNGSGKSNVIDSMLFVFGYRANKIRSKKISVLIHNSEKHQDINSCSVAVHFQKIIDTGVCVNFLFSHICCMSLYN